MLKHFAFYYNNGCPVHEETKYNASYWPQEPKLEKLKNTKKENRLWELNKNPTATFNLKTTKMLIIQEYKRAISNTKNQQTSKKYWTKPDY